MSLRSDLDSRKPAVHAQGIRRLLDLVESLERRLRASETPAGTLIGETEHGDKVYAVGKTHGPEVG